jgi:hypothetical protein
MPQGHSHETTELKLLFLGEGVRSQNGASFPRKRESSYMNHPSVAGQNQGFVRFADCMFCWIPAFAGMTIFLNALQRFCAVISIVARSMHDTYE